MISSKHTHAVPAMQIEWVTGEENTLQKKFFQDGMNLLPQKAIQNDNQTVFENLTKLLIYNGQEKIEK